MAAVAEHRKKATTEIREGKKFRVVRLPDRYDFTVRLEPPVQLRSSKKRQRAA